MRSLLPVQAGRAPLGLWTGYIKKSTFLDRSAKYKKASGLSTMLRRFVGFVGRLGFGKAWSAGLPICEHGPIFLAGFWLHPWYSGWDRAFHCRSPAVQPINAADVEIP
jgi:hypothetical protein